MTLVIEESVNKSLAEGVNIAQLNTKKKINASFVGTAYQIDKISTDFLLGWSSRNRAQLQTSNRDLDKIN